jgi:rhamnosyltransferase
MVYPRVAVLLAAYNGIDYIEEQISSILYQNNVCVDIFISVDRSNDGTETFLIEKYSSTINIKFLPFGIRYGSPSANFFNLIVNVDFSEYSYVSLADQDDIWLPNKLHRAHTVLASNNCQAYSSQYLIFRFDKVSISNKSSSFTDYDYLFESAGPGCTFVFTSELAKNIQILIKSNIEIINLIDYHDWLIYAFARFNNYKWIIDPYFSMLYRQHSTNYLGSGDGFLPFLRRISLILSGYGFSQSILIQKVLSDVAFSHFSNIYFILNFYKFRRKFIHKIYFLIISIFNIFHYKKIL